MRRAFTLVLGSLLAVACGVSHEPGENDGFGGFGGAGGQGAGGGQTHADGGSTSPPTQPQGPSSGDAGSSGGQGDGTAPADGGATPPAAPPKTVEDLVNLANSLQPFPLTIARFIAALPHPLALNATSSQFSAQPAVDADDPRIFIVMGNLVLSVVPTGPNVNTLEIGDLSNGEMSPAQISFPVTSPIAAAAPYQAVLNTTGGGGGGGGGAATATTCGKCHQKTGAEVEISQVSGTPVYAMGQITPFAQFNVPVTTIISLAQSCDPASNPERCDIFSALTTPSAPTQYAFP